MSPEQLRGREADARSDIFSLGVTLYECATGIHAFERGTPLQVSIRVVTETPTSPSVLNPAVPPRLDRIIARAMAKDPAGRYDSADSLRSDLVDLRQDLDGSAAVSRPVSTATSPRSAGPMPPYSQPAIFPIHGADRRGRRGHAAGGVVRSGAVSPRPPRTAARGRRLVQPGDQRHPRGGVLSGDQGVGARARDRWLFRPGARATVRSVRGDRTHRPGQGGTAAGHGAAPRSLGRCPTPSPCIWTLSRQH